MRRLHRLLGPPRRDRCLCFRPTCCFAVGLYTARGERRRHSLCCDGCVGRTSDVAELSSSSAGVCILDMENEDSDALTRLDDEKAMEHAASQGWQMVDIKAIKAALEDTERFGACFLSLGRSGGSVRADEVKEAPRVPVHLPDVFRNGVDRQNPSAAILEEDQAVLNCLFDGHSDLHWIFAA